MNLSDITGQFIAGLIGRHYDLACQHSILCTAKSECGCYDSIVSETIEKIQSILLQAALCESKRIPIDLICRFCGGNKENEEHIRVCGKTFETAAIGYETLVERLVSFLIDAVLSGSNKVVGLRKRVGMIIQYDRCFGERKLGYNMSHKANLSRSIYSNNRIYNGLHEASDSLRAKVEIIVEDYIIDRFVGLKCSAHNNNAIYCNAYAYGKKVGRCADLFLAEITGFVIQMINTVAEAEKNGAFWNKEKQFSENICMRCYGNNIYGYDKDAGAMAERNKKCENAFIEGCTTLAGMVMFFTEMALMSMESVILPAGGASRNSIAKNKPWLLGCPTNVSQLYDCKPPAGPVSKSTTYKTVVFSKEAHLFEGEIL